MRDRTRQRATFTAFLLALLVSLGSTTALATEPRPVIAVPDAEAPEEQPSDEAPAEDQPDESRGCLLGPAQGGASGQVAMEEPGGIRLAAYPGPVIEVPWAPETWDPVNPPEQPQDDACEASYALSLEVESPSQRDPQGADATLGGRLIPRATLESGFETTLTATTRTIGFRHPGEDWEITSVSCTCTGGAGASTAGATGFLASYAKPVIQAASGGASPGSTDCGGSVSSPAVAAAGGLVTGPVRASQVTAYPRPVIPVPSDPRGREPGSVAWDSSGYVYIDDPDQAGGAIDCAWKVEHVYGRLKVRTTTTPSGRESQFVWRVVPDEPGRGKAPVRLRGSASGDQVKLWHGGWSLALRNLDEAWEVKSSKCVESDSTTSSAAQGATAQVGMDPSDKVTCTFKLKLRSPKPGRWKAVNKPGWFTCTPKDDRLPPFTQKLPREEGSGTIRVLQGGEQLSAKGMGNTGKWLLNRNPEEQLRFDGKLTRTFAGAETTFKVRWRLVHEKRMEGTVTGKVKGDDAVCKYAGSVVLTHDGG